MNVGRRNNIGRWAPWILSGMVLLGLLVLNTSVGPVAIDPATITRLLLSRLPWLDITHSWPAGWQVILFQIRFPHAALMLLTGMALGGSGAAYQGLFRNPLADPYILGVASGAGLGAILAMSARWPDTGIGLVGIPVAAFVTALVTVAIVYGVARVGRTVPVTTLLLAGVAVGTFASALTSMIMLLSTNELRRAISWLLGGFALGGWGPFLASLPYIGIGLVTLVLMARPLNVLQLGDEDALQVGLDVEKYKLTIVLAATLTAATAVAFTGIIAFVGLIVPHLVRILWGVDYRRLIPLATVGGGIVLLAADILARTLLAPRDLPVGVITSLAGAPFFLWLLRRAKQEIFW